MERDRIYENLGKQMELLTEIAEKSKDAPTVVEVTHAMVEVAKLLLGDFTRKLI